MPIAVRLIDDPVLRVSCKEVQMGEADYVGFISTLLLEMNETMKAESGIGLAANQIGFPVRVFILKKDDSYEEYINPEMLAFEEQTILKDEGCLSVPGVSADTTRWNKVKLSWLTKNGIRKEEEFTGMQAFAIQHEMDHLNGKLYVDQFSSLKRELIVKKHKKFVKLRR